MIPSKLPFIWYDDINSQNQYKENCQASCDYKLITPNTKMLPFEIRTNISGQGVTTDWKIYCNDGTLLVDLSLSIAILSFPVVDGFTYLIYEGDQLLDEALQPITLACGSYYSTIGVLFNDVTYTYYSEVFEVVDFTETATVEDLPLFTPFRWYNNIEKQNQYKANCLNDCGYCLISKSFPTFQIKTLAPQLSSGTTAYPLDIYCSDGTLLVQAAAPFDIVVLDGFYYLIYTGADILTLPFLAPLELECGTYYAHIKVEIESIEYNFYSELFCIKDDIGTVTDGYLQTDSGVNLTDDSGIQLTVD